LPAVAAPRLQAREGADVLTYTGSDQSMNRLRAALEAFLRPDQILDRPIDRAAYASDASFYRLVPQAVVRPRSLDDIRALFAFGRKQRIPLTFRAAGTSLSGQAITEGILVDISRHWRAIQPLDGGRRVRVQPGAIGGHVNRTLAPLEARIGPDPASIDACMMGGILANNSSGMCCGVAQNSYHTLESLVFVLPSGTTIDTADPEAATAFERAEPQLAAGLRSLRDRVRANRALAARIRTKYLAKNTTGYSLNALIDFDEPIDIIRHLLIGSEGTLAFIAEAVLRTVPELPVRYTGLLLFPDIAAACRAVRPLADAGAAALEVMDRAALRSVAHVPGVPASLTSAGPDVAGLLVEFQEQLGTPIEAIASRAAAVIERMDLYEPARFSADAVERALLWRVRKGMFPSVGAVRPRGTTVLTEDIAVPIDALAPAVTDLRRIFHRHAYDDAIVFGHAKDGNLHFVLSQSFNDAAAIDQYARLMDDVVEMVVGTYDGALKAEHGTGRNMAPFVEAEWGADGYAIMKEVKALIDPDQILNPGVILNDDPRIHLKDIKPLPQVEEEVDRCIECGFCESYCPSRDLTLTPRQRIMIRREMERPGADRASLAAAFEYDGLQTCAVDGLCQLACPVRIDTGALTKKLRQRSQPAGAEVAARWTARHFGAASSLARVGLRIAGRLPSALVARAGLEPPLPRPASGVPQTNGHAADAIYFPGCVSRILGPLPDEDSSSSVAAAFVEVARRAGLRLAIPPDAANHCCGMPYSSKGLSEAHAIAANRTIEFLWNASDNGRVPLVTDTSPCTYSLASTDALGPENRDRRSRLRIVDGLEYFATEVLPRLSLTRQPGVVTVHSVCSLVKLGRTDHLMAIASACSESVFVPASTGCCGFAGDRGWLVPELTASATRDMAEELRGREIRGHYSSSRTCEIGMSRATGRPYRSWIYLLEEASRSSL
jgi:D-lactate dehydrogenase